MQRLAESSEGSEATSADGTTHRDDDSGNSKGSGKDKKQIGWLNKSVFLASGVLRNAQIAAKRIASQMSTHDVAGPLIKRHMNNNIWY